MLGKFRYRPRTRRLSGIVRVTRWVSESANAFAERLRLGDSSAVGQARALYRERLSIYQQLMGGENQPLREPGLAEDTFGEAMRQKGIADGIRDEVLKVGVDVGG